MEQIIFYAQAHWIEWLLAVLTGLAGIGDRGYCPIYAKETLKHVYEAYHNLGGNDVATKLYHTLLEMPEELKERED